jgi:NAD(P)H-flavin reductase
MKVKIQSIKRFQENNFFMKVKPEKKLDFKAGQFLMIKYQGVEKPFSIASFPGEETVDFLISTHPDGKLTPKLAKLKIGEGFEIEGPYGVFGVRDTKAREIIFIAAGTGIAPFRSMVMDALQRFQKKKIKLVFGFRYDFYFEKYWKELDSSYENFTLSACCSKPDKKWRGKSGRVTEHLEEEIRNAKDKEVYICGPPPMVQDTKDILEKKLGFKKEQIRLEKW